MFIPRKVDRQRAEQIEPLGTKFKFWFTENGTRCLFKAEERGTGEDWAEVVACHLCALLGLPHVEYELAEDWDGDRYIQPGVACPNMAPDPVSLFLGNVLLPFVQPDYPRDQKRKVHAYTVEAVAGVVRLLDPPDAKAMTSVPAEVSTAMDVFVGYMMLDAWIANQDRHHENWGALLTGDRFRLAATFDHGASMARNETDEIRQRRLTTKDRGFSVATYAGKAKTPFFGASPTTGNLTTMEVYEAFAAEAPAAALAWKARLRDISDAQVQAVLDEVPNKRMTSVAKQFTAQLLGVNRERILQGKDV